MSTLRAALQAIAEAEMRGMKAEMRRAPVYWRGAPPSAGQRFVRYLGERNDGRMALGAASIDPRWQSMPFDMGLAAIGGGAGILALNRLALEDRAITPGQREQGRRLRERISMLRNANREQDAREWGYMTGLEQENDALRQDVSQMYQAPYQDEAARTAYRRSDAVR